MVAVVHTGIQARWELADIAPTTLAGLVAYLDYVVVENEKLEWQRRSVFL
jgi:hypothetical protein